MEEEEEEAAMKGYFRKRFKKRPTRLILTTHGMLLSPITSCSDQTLENGNTPVADKDLNDDHHEILASSDVSSANATSPGSKENDFRAEYHVCPENLPPTPAKTNSKKRKEDGMDLKKRKSPQKRPRNKIYRPKVIGEGRPKRSKTKHSSISIQPQTPKPRTPERVSSKKTGGKCRRSLNLNLDTDENSEEQQRNGLLGGKANVFQTGCQSDFRQSTWKIDRSGDCLNTSAKMSLNFPIFFKRKRIMGRIKLDDRRRNANARALIDELPSVVKTKKKRSKRCTRRKDLLAGSPKIALSKDSQLTSPLLERQESETSWKPRTTMDTLSSAGNEGTIFNLELNNNQSEESMLKHENFLLHNNQSEQGLIAESSTGTFLSVSNLELQSSQSEGSPLQCHNISFASELKDIAEGLMRSCVEMEPSFIDLNLQLGRSERSLLEYADSLMIDSYQRLLGQYQNADVHQNERHIVPRGKLPEEAPNENLDVPRTENSILIPVQHRQISVIKKTKKQAALEIYSNNIKAWRLQLKSITNVDEETLDEETNEKLESERNLFHGRIQAFTACMHVIQGDRRFSPWKGSVVDSVVGVFLTQNVSDNLSSSAFMSLAAKFPAQPSKHEDILESIPNNSKCTSPVNHFVSPQLLLREASTEDTSDMKDVAPKSQETTLVGPHSSPSKSYLTSDYNSEDNKPGSSVDDAFEKTAGKKKKREQKKKDDEIDWDALRRTWHRNGERNKEHMDSVDWEVVRRVDTSDIADAIKARGQHNIIADRIKEFLDRVVQLHKNIDLEWLRHAPPDKVKEYLLHFNGLGLKSVECIRLLGLQHVAFPVDTNVGRIAIRLGWVPLEPLPEELHVHLLQQYPIMDSIQKYLWPRLSTLDQETLYELHYQLITFGKVYCTKRNPNCNSCPMRGECRHFASACASARRALPGPTKKGKASSTASSMAFNSPGLAIREASSSLLEPGLSLESEYQTKNCEPIIEEPASPEPVYTELCRDIEDYVVEDDPNEIPTIRLNGGEYTTNLERLCMEMRMMALEDNQVSKALVVSAPQVATWPVPKLKHASRLRTKHLVYEIPDSHHILDELDRREPDDPCPYLLAIWKPGETASSFQPVEEVCSSQECGSLCNEETCTPCNILKEQNANTIRGTILIPCRTAMRGSFPLNGTYFQVNEVFADHKTSEHPIDVPREWLWNLPRRIAYFGTSTTAIFRGLSTEEIQNCFWKGFICIRAFDRETRMPMRLAHRLHISTTEAGKSKRSKPTEDE